MRGVAVMLNGNLADPDQSVTVKSGGRMLFTGPVPGTSSRIEPTMSERGDSSLLLSAAINVKPAGT